MIRNGVGILFFLMSGFFVYTIGLLAFFDIPDAGAEKLMILGGFGIPLVILHLIGLAFYRGSSWKILTGITFFLGGAFNLLTIITMLSIKASPGIVEIMDTSSLNAFSDYILGFVVTTIFMGVGATLYWLDRPAKNSSSSDATNSAGS